MAAKQMRTITLSNSPLLAVIDDDDFERCTSINWCLTGKGYAQGTFETEKVYLHRFVMWEFGKLRLDHIDRDKLNCTKRNLRYATNSQNGINKNKRRGGSSFFKGVSWCNTQQKWIAQIMFNQRNQNLGYYDSEYEAADAYDVAALQIFGEFALLNKP